MDTSTFPPVYLNWWGLVKAVNKDKQPGPLHSQTFYYLQRTTGQIQFLNVTKDVDCPRTQAKQLLDSLAQHYLPIWNVTPELEAEWIADFLKKEINPSVWDFPQTNEPKSASSAVALFYKALHDHKLEEERWTHCRFFAVFKLIDEFCRAENVQFENDPPWRQVLEEDLDLSAVPISEGDGGTVELQPHEIIAQYGPGSLHHQLEVIHSPPTDSATEQKAQESNSCASPLRTARRGTPTNESSLLSPPHFSPSKRRHSPLTKGGGPHPSPIAQATQARLAKLTERCSFGEVDRRMNALASAISTKGGSHPASSKGRGKSPVKTPGISRNDTAHSLLASLISPVPFTPHAAFHTGDRSESPSRTAHMSAMRRRVMRSDRVEMKQRYVRQHGESPRGFTPASARRSSNEDERRSDDPRMKQHIVRLEREVEHLADRLQYYEQREGMRAESIHRSPATLSSTDAAYHTAEVHRLVHTPLAVPLGATEQLAREHLLDDTSWLSHKVEDDWRDKNKKVPFIPIEKFRHTGPTFSGTQRLKTAAEEEQSKTKPTASATPDGNGTTTISEYEPPSRYDRETVECKVKCVRSKMCLAILEEDITSKRKQLDGLRNMLASYEFRRVSMSVGTTVEEEKDRMKENLRREEAVLEKLFDERRALTKSISSMEEQLTQKKSPLNSNSMMKA